jgi:protoporphyrinogen oxidase
MSGCESRVTILGAGLAGLSAAWFLARLGVPVRVIEREDCAGGMAMTIKRGEYRFDLGPHRFYTQDQQVLNMIKELMGEELLIHERTSRVRLNGRYLDYPPNVANLVRCMEPKTSLQCLLDYFSSSWNGNGKHEDEADFQSWVINRFGRHLYDIYFGPYTEKVWGISPKFLAAELARRRIAVPNLGEVLMRLMFSSNGDQNPYVTRFWYPKAGIGRIAERLVEDIIDHNGEILFGHKVEQIHLENEQVIGLTVNNGTGTELIPSQWVLSTLPLPYLIESINPSQTMLSEQVNNVTYRALIFVYLMINGDQIGKDHWLYFPQKDYIFNRVSEPITFSSTHAPIGKTSLCVEITCKEADELWELPVEELYQQVIRDLKKAGLIDPEQVEGLFTYRFPWGYPIYTVDYERYLNRLLAYVDELDNLVTFGRQGAFDYSNMSESIASGLKTAELISKRIVENDEQSVVIGAV